MTRHMKNRDSRDTAEGSSILSKSSLSLGNVIQLCPHDKMKVQTSVIAVPGYYTPPVRSWDVKSELEKAAASINNISNMHMYIHQPVYCSAEEFTWEAFLNKGSELAEDLARLSIEFPDRPLIFIAHSLGGILVKQALLLAHQNLQDPRFKVVVDCLSGILFLGTPHASVTDEDTLIRHNQLLYSCAKISVEKQPSRLSAHDVFQLANLAATFEQIANVPVLSVYENPDQKSNMQRILGRGKLGRGKKVLVDEQLATISSNAEHILGVRLTHSELCKLPLLKDGAYSAREFLHSLLEDLAKNDWKPTLSDSISQHLVSNPLNPLNLAPVEPLDKGKGKIMSSSTGRDRGRFKGSSSASISSFESAQTQFKLPFHLRLVSTNTDRILETRKAHLPCFRLAQHSPNLNFVGRKDAFGLMDEYLLPRELQDSGNIQNTRLFGLCGMGGIGKTDLAVQYAFSRRDKFGAVFWLEAGGVSQLASDFGRIAAQLGLESSDEAQDLASSKEIAKAWLSKPRGSFFQADGERENDNWLLIFDNADILDIIADYLPWSGNGSVLITSRDPFAKTLFFNNGSGLDLEPLETTEAATLLYKLINQTEDAQSPDEHKASIQIATQLDGLPLAMTQMAGFIRRRHISIREFVDLYNSDARYAEIHDVSNPLQDHRYGYTLATAYNFQGLSKFATHLLRVLAFMNPDRIREDIFLNPRRQDENANNMWTATAFENARFDLVMSSIIKRNIHKKELWIHRVIQAEVRARMDERERYQAFKKAVSLLSALWPPGDLCSQASERWELCENLLPHLERFYQLYTDHSGTWDSFEIDPTFPAILNEAALYLHERGFSHEGKAYLRLALELCQRANISQEPLVSDMHLTMGALSNETNDAQSCLEHNILCLALRKAEAAKNNVPDLRLAFAHSQMGIAYMMIKKFALATEYFKQCIEMIKGLDVDVDEFGFPVCNLGLAYLVQGELDIADQTLTDLLTQRERRHGKMDKVSYKTGRVLQALGNVKAAKAMRLEAQNNHAAAKILWDEVFAIHTNCLKQYESTLGKFNHRTGDACHKLAEYHIRMKEHALAQDYLDRALSIWGDRQWFKNESARSSYLRGIHLQSMGGDENIENGKRWVERAMLLRKEILPNEEPRKLDTRDFDDLVCFWSF